MLKPIRKIINRKFYRNLFYGFSVFFFIYPFFIRILNGHLAVSYNFDDSKLIAVAFFKHDCLIIAVLLILYAFSSITNNLNLKTISRLLMCAILFLYYLDLTVFKIFNTRLSFDDLVHYMPNVGFAGDFINFTILAVIIAPIFIVIVFFSSIVFAVHRGPQDKKVLGVILALALTLGGYYFKESSNDNFIHSWMFKNFIELNFGRSLDKKYSEDFIKIVLESKRIEGKQCTQNKKITNKKNLIILMLESFSMYHSDYFSGINDFTPNLDAIACKGKSFTNFISNGFTTEHALISIFTGKFPIPCVKESQYNFFSDSFEGYYDLENALPKLLAQNGYSSDFFTTGNLGFSNKGAWLNNIGFDYIEGHDASFYTNYKRFHFDGASDDALYKRVLSRLKEQGANVPFFIAIETTSTHLPFIDPITEVRSESLAVQFADNALGEFYEGLNKEGFFDNGILIIVSDHRSMTLLTEKETEIFGPKAPAIIPMIILGDGFIGVENKMFQQTDIYASVVNYVSNKACTSKYSGDFLESPSISPQYAIYVRGDDRSMINIYGDREVGAVRLEGDKTRLISGALENDGEVVLKINYERIARSLIDNEKITKTIRANIQ